MEKEKFETRVAKIQERDGICHVEIKHRTVVKLEDVKDIDEVFIKLANEYRIVICANISHIRYITFKARKYRSQSPTNKLIIAIALITNNHVARVIANFIMGMNKPSFNVRIFASESAGLDWLQKFTQLKNEKIIPIEKQTCDNKK